MYNNFNVVCVIACMFNCLTVGKYVNACAMFSLSVCVCVNVHQINDKIPLSKALIDDFLGKCDLYCIEILCTL